ncbi:factor activating pos9 [Cryptotrichosporon argae]
MTTHHARQHPIILITGTPGTGKTLHSTLLAAESAGDGEDGAPALVHLNVGDLVKQHGFHEGYDEQWRAYTVDEDRLLDYMEEIVNPRDGPAATGFIIDHHDPSLFPERWIDLVVVLTCDNGVLHSRLTERGYPEQKLTENITAEIMQTCLSEAHDSYAPEIIVELRSDGSGGEGELDANVGRIAAWAAGWRRDREAGVHGGNDEA